MKERFVKNRMGIIIGAFILLVLTVGISIAVVLYNNSHSGNEISEIVKYAFHKANPEKLDNHHDIGVMISDCDDASSFRTMDNGFVINRKGKYVQGTGAIKFGSLYKNRAFYAYLSTVDISAYAEGSVHVSLYVNNPKHFENHLTIELSSSGTHDKDEISWQIHSSLLEPGWNELYLGMKDARVKGEPNLKKINYSRIYTLDAKLQLDVIIDCIYATDTPGMSLEGNSRSSELASTKKGYLMDADSLKGLKSQGTMELITAKKEVKEGKASVAVSGTPEMWIQANLKTADLTKYKNGRLTFWLYIDNASYVKENQLRIELSSSGIYDENEITWYLSGSELKTGWNEVSLPMTLAVKTSSEKIDLSKVNFFRIWSKDTNKNLIFIIDAVRMAELPKRVPDDGMIADCDAKEDYGISSDNKVTLVTQKKEHIKQGKGSLKIVGSGKTWLQLLLTELVDVSKYADGALHVWLYVDDVSKLNSSVAVELGSGGKCDVDEYQWNYSELKSGWNELILDFDSARVTGKPDLSNINFFRVYCSKMGGEVTVVVDDVRAMHLEGRDQAPGVLLDCDSTVGVQVSSKAPFSVTKVQSEYKEGIGAAKRTGTASNRFQVNKAWDLTKYKEGELHLWLYVSNVQSMPSEYITVAFDSGTLQFSSKDQNMYSWNIPKSELNDGAWTELFIDLANPTYQGTGFDWSAIKGIKIHMNNTASAKSITTIVDDVYVTTGQSRLTLHNCDTNIENGVTEFTNVAGEVKEGIGAYKLEGAGDYHIAAKLYKGVDLSEYQDGELQFWLYIGDKSAIKSEYMMVEISSSKQADNSELQWWYHVSDLQENSWNLVTLNFDDAKAYNGKTGPIDFSNINFFRCRMNKEESVENLIFIIDDIRIVKEEIENEPEETLEPGVILSCDTIINIDYSEGFKKTIEESEVKVGNGAFKSSGPGQDRFEASLKSAIDISAYKDGALQFWLYVGDKSAFISDNIKIEISSSGQCDNSELQWTYQLSKLEENQWNQVTLYFKDAVLREGTTGAIDFAKINYFRIYTNKRETSDKIQMLLDAVRAVIPTIEAPDSAKFTIHNCDTNPNAEITILTEVAGEFKEGTGAAKRVGNANNRFQINKKWNLTNYQAGTLHLWLYVSDVEQLPNDYVTIALASSDILSFTDDTAYYWNVPKSELKNGGWKELCLDLDNPTQAGAGFNWSTVTGIKVHLGGVAKQSITTIVDDVFVTKEKIVPSPDENISSNLVIHNCDTTPDASNFQLTTEASEVKQGTGAVKRTDNKNNRFQAAMNKDLSSYKEGTLCLWFYISDVTQVKKDYIVVNLASSLNAAGTSPQFSGSTAHEWQIPKSELKSGGWTKLFLDCANPTTPGADFNWSTVRGIKIHFGNEEAKSAITTIVDDIYVTTEITKLGLHSCDTNPDANNFQLTTEPTEVKEGAGAVKRTDKKNNRFQVSMDDKDLSSYKEGTLCLWFYISDVTQVKKDYIVVNLASSLNTAGTSPQFSGSTAHEWQIPKSELKSGEWTKLFLDCTNPTTPGADFNWSTVKGIKIHFGNEEAKSAITTIVDDIYVTKEKIAPSPDENISSNLGLHSCDTNPDANNFQLTTEASEVKQGTGAVKRTDKKNNRFQVSMDKDLSSYKEGTLCLWFYISDVTQVKKDYIVVNLASSLNAAGTSPQFSGSTAHEWQIPKSELSSGGWAKLFLDCTNPTTAGADFNWSTVRGIKIHFGNEEAENAITTIVDDIYVTKEIPKLGLHSCDTNPDANNFQLTTEASEVKQGTGAVKRTDKKNNRFQASMDKDLSGYQEGIICLWIYVSDVTQLKKDYIVVNLASSLNAAGTSPQFSGSTAHEWQIPKSQLTSGGWTKLSLDCANPTNAGADFNWSTVRGIKIHFGNEEAKNAITTIVDEIYVTK